MTVDRGPTSQAMFDTIDRLNLKAGTGDRVKSITWHGGAHLIVAVRQWGKGYTDYKATMLSGHRVRFRGNVAKVEPSTEEQQRQTFPH